MDKTKCDGNHGGPPCNDPECWNNPVDVRLSTAPANATEPFGYFRADAMGWTDCAATDEGAIALYERPAAPAVPQSFQPIETIKYWADAYSDRSSGPHFQGHGMVVTMLREYEQLRTILASTPAAPSQEPVKRPQNCGTSFCSCIECVCEPSQPVTLTDEPVAYIETITGRLCATHDEHRLKFPMCYAPLYTRPAASPQSQTDEVFEALELDPESFRTEGGAVNASKLKATILHPYNYLHRDHWLQARFSKPGGRPLATDASGPLTEIEMEKGREQLFSTNNPYCPCDRKTFKKVAEWVERHHGITALREKERAK